MSKLFIFGTGQVAELANYYFENDSQHTVVGFCVDPEHLPVSEKFLDKRVVAITDVDMEFPNYEFKVFIALGYSELNSNRLEKFNLFQKKGYIFANYLSTRATILTTRISSQNTFILENNTLQPFSEIGKNVFLWSGNHIGHHSIVEDHCFIASHVVISGNVRVGSQSFLGVNSTLRDSISIGKKTVVGAGALVLKDVPEGSVIPGNKSTPIVGKSSQLRKI